MQVALKCVQDLFFFFSKIHICVFKRKKVMHGRQLIEFLIRRFYQQSLLLRFAKGKKNLKKELRGSGSVSVSVSVPTSSHHASGPGIITDQRQGSLKGRPRAHWLSVCLGISSLSSPLPSPPPLSRFLSLSPCPLSLFHPGTSWR